jgi:peptide/nickel transport system substrate-binding protein
VAEVKSDGSGGANYSHYGVVIPGIDDLLDKAGNEPDYDKRLALIQEAERKAMTDLPVLPIATNGYLIARDPRVTLGYEVSSGYAYWRLDKAKIA